MINCFHYRNRILQMQNQMSNGHFDKIAACGRLEITNKIYD